MKEKHIACTIVCFFIPIGEILAQSLLRQTQNATFVWGDSQLGYDTSRIRENEVFVTLINKSGRRANIYQSNSNGYEIFYRFTIRPNERKTLSFLPDGSFFEAFDFLTKRELIINGYRRLETNRLYTGFPYEAFITTYNLPPEFNPKAKMPSFYIETLVVADQSMIKYHGEHLENYTMTLMNMVTRVFMHKSLNTPIYISVTKFTKMEVLPLNYNIEANNPASSVEAACQFANTLLNDNYTFDFVLILTRENIGPSGYALMYTMCSKKSCALVKEDGFDSAFVIAHELGHSLGIDHDEGLCIPPGNANIMAKKIYTTSSNYMWSECSQRILKENLNFFPCLTNIPKLLHSFQVSMMNLPGESVSLDKQCQMHYGNQSSSCTVQVSVCRYLWCHPKHGAPCTPLWLQSPLEGSTCDNGKWCINSACIAKKKQLPIHGGWSQWSEYFPACDNATKHLLIQQRNRSCTYPKPEFNGNPCKGISYEKRVVLPDEKETCSPYTLQKLSLNQVLYQKATLRDECEKIKKDNKVWTFYSDDMQKAYFKSLNVSCDFEREGCQWKSSEKGVKGWNVGQGPTASINTGPSFDHTFKNVSGHYLYFEASWIHGTPRLKNNDRIILESPTIVAPWACLKFAYHMYGSDVKGLEVFLNNGMHRKKIWHREGPQGNNWNTVELDLSISIEYFITIEAIRGNSHTSDIAIDDIMFDNGLCSSPKINLSHQCSIACVDNDLTTMLKTNVYDGTPCLSIETDNSLCINKKCEPVNCDGIIGKSIC